MEEIPTADLVYQRIYACFIDYDPIKRRNAQKYLEQFQKSTYSWAIAVKLLQQNRDLHSTFFAAQTIRKKIENCLKELPCESVASLKDTLIVQIGRLNRHTDSASLRQLCWAMAELVLLMDTWEQPIADLLNSALAQQPENVLPLIQIFTLIAEEMDSGFLRLEQHRREKVIRQFCAVASQVLQFLGMSLKQASPDQEVVMSAVLGCFSAWIAVYAVPMENIMENPIVQKVFSLLRFENTSRKLHKNAKDCLCTLLKSLESDDGRVQVGHIVEVQIFNGVCGLQSAYNSSVARRDIARSTNFCFVFTAMCEAFLPSMLTIAENPHHTVKALSLVLKCVNHTNSKVAEITFSFWERLSEALFQRKNNRLTSHFGTYVQQLFAALYRHSIMKENRSGLEDELEDFHQFRNKISKLIKDTVFIVGAESSFREMICVLHSPTATWQDTEAALFMMSNVAEKITPDACTLVRYTNPDLPTGEVHPMLQMLTDGWPLVSQLLHKFQWNVRIMERTCPLIRYGLRKVRNQASMLAQPLARQLSSLYSGQQYSCFLYLASVLVEQLGQNEHCIYELLVMLNGFVEPTLSMLHVGQGFVKRPDIVQNFFRLCCCFVETAPVDFLHNAPVARIFKCAVTACTLAHRNANSAVMMFLGKLLKCGRSSNSESMGVGALIVELCEQDGEWLITNLMQSMLCYSHLFMLADISEVLSVLKEVITPQLLHNYLKNASESLPNEHGERRMAATQEQLQEMCNTVLRDLHEPISLNRSANAVKIIDFHDLVFKID